MRDDVKLMCTISPLLGFWVYDLLSDNRQVAGAMRVFLEKRLLLVWNRTGAIYLVCEIDAIVEIIASHGRLDAAGQIASELVRPATIRIGTCRRVV